MNVWIVVVNSRINSVWAEEVDAREHLVSLLRANSDQLAARIECLEVRRR